MNGSIDTLHALSLPARRHLLDPEPIKAEATVAFGRDPADGGYELRADLVVSWPGVADETAARCSHRRPPCAPTRR
ncbi:hypothetical protein ACIBQX_48645 [Nonomuraea sp. NPDC049714]|uniref:hypothetical protein n=1 Tax=Nonomuraea sp. NPDC049714 TaxID=3364357 RepID=UPI0037AFC77B